MTPGRMASSICVGEWLGVNCLCTKIRFKNDADKTMQIIDRKVVLMCHDSEKSGNINAQYLYSQFETKFDEMYRNKKSNEHAFSIWLISYGKTKTFKLHIICLIAITLVVIAHNTYFPNNKNDRFFKGVYAIVIGSFASFSFADYFLNHTEKEKQIASDAIDDVFHDININMNERALEMIIETSQSIGSREFKALDEMQRIISKMDIRSMLMMLLGIIFGCFSSIMSKESEKSFTEDFSYLLIAYIICILLAYAINVVVYFAIKWTHRKTDLYIEVLKDKRFTLICRGNGIED